MKNSDVEKNPSEIWIKLLFAVASIAVILIGYMGNRLIDGQDRTTNAVGNITGSLKAFESRISRSEADITEVNVKVDGNSDRIYKLEGAK